MCYNKYSAIALLRVHTSHSLLYGIQENQVCGHYTESLKENAAPGRIVQVIQFDYFAVHYDSEFGQEPFKPCKKWGIIQSPLRSVLI